MPGRLTNSGRGSAVLGGECCRLMQTESRLHRNRAILETWSDWTILGGQLLRRIPPKNPGIKIFKYHCILLRRRFALVNN